MSTTSWSQLQTEQHQHATSTTLVTPEKSIAFIDTFFSTTITPHPSPEMNHQLQAPPASQLTNESSISAHRYFMDSPTEGDRLEMKTDPFVVGQQLVMTGLRHNMTALDIGCGSGAVARIMAQITGPHLVTGVDASQARLEQAYRRAAEQQINITWVQATSFRLPFADNEFDYTHARMLFQYLAQPLATLKEMARVTKPGGYIVVSDLDNQLVNLYPMADEVHAELETALKILATEGFDPYVGRKLHAYFVEENLHDIQVWTLPYQVYYGGQLPLRDKLNWEQKLTTATSYLARVTGETERWQRFRSTYLAALTAPQAYYASTQVLVRALKST